MVSVYETAYPRLKNNSSSREIQDIYSPTPEEIAFAQESTQTDKTYLLTLRSKGNRLELTQGIESRM